MGCCRMEHMQIAYPRADDRIPIFSPHHHLGVLCEMALRPQHSFVDGSMLSEHDGDFQGFWNTDCPCSFVTEMVFSIHVGRTGSFAQP
jgi:hypothetical protein